MGRTTRILLAAAAAASFGMATAKAQAQSFMPTGGISSQPVGHYDFCRRHADECQPTRASGPVELTRELWAKIIDVNNHVNSTVRPLTDMQMWGVEEYWSYPVNGVGDCEDYALEKRRLLIAAGVPASSLLVTVVRQQNGDGHAVLTVTTSMGDFVLDNLEARVLPWRDTDYRFLKRISSRHAGMWMDIDDGRDILVGSVGSR